MTTQKTQLCTVNQLMQSLNSSNVVVIDASWYMPAAKIDCLNEFQNQRIKGAVFFDIDEVCDQDSSLPHMLPSSRQFAEAMNRLGISNEASIVVYDTAGLFSAARVWWMFKIFGHQDVRVLDGGQPAWLAAGGELASGTIRTMATEPENTYIAEINETFLANKDVLKGNCSLGEYLVLDARPNGRFTGAQPEPRAGLSSGHMPNSKSLPFDMLIENGRLKSVSDLRAIFSGYGLNADQDRQPIVSSCGSGVTAAIISLALVEAGFAMHKLYDGAWAEWASSDDTIVLQGE